MKFDSHVVYAVFSERGQLIVAFKKRVRAYEFCKNLINPIIRRMKLTGEAQVVICAR